MPSTSFSKTRSKVSRSQRNKMKALTEARLRKRLQPEELDPSSQQPAQPELLVSSEPSPSTPQPSTPEPELHLSSESPHAASSETPVSASKRKLEYFQETSMLDVSSSELPTTVLDLNTLQPLFSTSVCSSCGASPLTLSEGKGSKAFGVHLILRCSGCGETSSSINTSTKTGQKCNINKSIIAAGLTMGLGHSALQKLSEGLGMPGIHHQSYLDILDDIFKMAPKIAEVILTLSREKVKAFYTEHERDRYEDGILNLSVSFDGSWPKRGHTSKLGFGAVIDLLTGLVVDFHVMSTHCQVCSRKESALKEEELERWREEHKASGSCLRNFEGSSGAMEVEAALVLWRRSLDHSMRYTTLLGDGDTKTYLALTRANPYGDDHPIAKEECVNHVAKRLNTGLRNLKTTLTKKSIKIGGNAKGSLSDPKIGQLQSYYTRAVRGHNQSVEDMSSAIWATFYHSTMNHDKCPTGQDSWCWFQRDLARGIKEPQLGSRKQSTFLNELAAEHVRGVYERLTDPALLKRCLLGKTQNTNECLHSMIWLRCPKHLWSGYKRVFIACLLGVGEFNMGSLATRIFLDGVDCVVNERCFLLGDRRDRVRVQMAETAVREDVKRRREKKKMAEQKERERYEEIEGGPSYAAGGW